MRSMRSKGRADLIKMISLNVSGIRNNVKRSALFEWMKSLKVDLVFMQETHCGTHDDEIQRSK